MTHVFVGIGRRIADWANAIKQSRRERRDAAKLKAASVGRAASPATFVGVTGSSGKTTATALLSHILRGHDTVKEQADGNTLLSLRSTLRRQPTERYVVAEVGLSTVDSVRQMAELLKPDVAIITLIGLEHYSVFRTLEAVAAEKGTLVSNVQTGGFAVLNADDPHAMAMAALTAERIVTFGQSQAADYRATNIRAAFPDRLSLTVEWKGGKLDLQSRYLAKHFWLPLTAAVATALELGVPPQLIAERVSNSEPIRNRFGLIDVPDGPKFIIDTTKAPWHSLQLAFKALADASAPRKRLVLGQLSDFPGSDSKYRKAYSAGRAIADQVMFVGDHSHRSGANQQDCAEERFVPFTTPREVADHICRTASPGELILLKGSSNLHLERIALSWIEDVQCWVPACGLREGCEACGLYGTPYEIHRGRKNWRRRERRRLLLKHWKLLSRRP